MSDDPIEGAPGSIRTTSVGAMGVEEAMLARVTFDAAHDAEGFRARMIQRTSACAAAVVAIGVPTGWVFEGMTWPLVVVALLAVFGAATAWLLCVMGAVAVSEPLLRWGLRRQARAFGARPGMAARQLDAARAVIDEEDRARFGGGPSTPPAP